MIIKDFQGYEAEVVINVCSAIIANLGSILCQVQCRVANILPFQPWSSLVVLASHKTQNPQNRICYYSNAEWFIEWILQYKINHDQKDRAVVWFKFLDEYKQKCHLVFAGLYTALDRTKLLWRVPFTK